MAKGRRHFLRHSGLTIAAAALFDHAIYTPISAQPAKSTVGEPALPGATRRLARSVVTARYADLPEAVRHEAKRTLLNWVGCAIGGSHDETVINAIAAVAPFAGAAQATLFGRTERLDALNARIGKRHRVPRVRLRRHPRGNGIHPAAPVVPALLALAE